MLYRICYFLAQGFFLFIEVVNTFFAALPTTEDPDGNGGGNMVGSFIVVFYTIRVINFPMHYM